MDENKTIELPELETKCEDCGGKGFHPNYAGRCYGCHGTGYITTEFGEKVLELMRRNFRLMLKDEMD
jgi:DnaJ-class molecular chaperone